MVRLGQRQSGGARHWDKGGVVDTIGGVGGAVLN